VTLLLTLLIMAVLGLVVAVATGRIVGGLDRPASSLPGRGLPSGPIGVGDLDRVRFSPALRGYRMDEVDDVLDRVAEELRRRDEELAELRMRAASGHLPFAAAFPAAFPDRTDADIPGEARQTDDDTGGPTVPGEAYESHPPGPEAREAALWRRPANGSRPDPSPASSGVPATPPRSGRDESGGGR
jgi:DivIVA domain-containing protein